MRPDIDKMREHYLQGAYIASGHPGVIMKLLAYVEELERDFCRIFSDVVEISEAADKDDIPRTIARAVLQDWRARMEEIDET